MRAPGHCLYGLKVIPQPVFSELDWHTVRLHIYTHFDSYLTKILIHYLYFLSRPYS